MEVQKERLGYRKTNVKIKDVDRILPYYVSDGRGLFTHLSVSVPIQNE